MEGQNTERRDRGCECSGVSAAHRPHGRSQKHPHEHSHGHTHSLIPDKSHLNRAFSIGIILNLVYVAIEFGAGLWLNSLALISDAGHNLSDVISLVLALLAFKLTEVKPNSRFTYGYKKSTVLVSLLNACILLVAVGFIMRESIGKLGDPQPVEGGIIAWVAGVGILVNAFTAWLFIKDRKRDLNVQGAFLHMAADALVSVGVVVSGIAISFTGWYIIDPIIGIAIAVAILISTARLLFDSLRLSLDGVPAGIDPEKVKAAIMEHEPEAIDVHHVHIWAISTTENALTAHVVIRSQREEGAVKARLKELLARQGIRHATLEFELPSEACCPPGDCGQPETSDNGENIL